MKRASLIFLTHLLAAGAIQTHAQTISTPEQLAPMADTFRKVWKETDKPVRMTVPLHGGILELSMPVGFVPGFKVEQDGTFMMAFVPDGETFPFFSRALLIQSSATLGGAPYSDSEIAEGIYKPRECIGSPLWKAVGEKQVGPNTTAYLASTGCPALSQDPSKGQQTFFASVRGRPHAFAVSWAVRSAAFAVTAPPIDLDQTEAQLAPLGELLFCTSANQTKCKDVFAREAIRQRAR